MTATAAPLRRGRPPGMLPMLGPAFVAAVAYVDPGNFATNISAGAQHGYLLVWVIVGSNLLAVLVQYLSAKLGIATGEDLPTQCRRAYPRPVTRGLWVQAELVAMATDLAEVIGGALALNLLFGLPLLTGGLITGAVAFALLALTGRGHRPFEHAVIGCLAVILLGFVVSLAGTSPDAVDLAAGLVPRLAGTETVLLASGILGATVMPHVIYLHSALTAQRARDADEGRRRDLLRVQRVDIPIAMGTAGLINLAMLVLAATVFHARGRTDVDTIEAAHAGLGTELGSGAALAFALALLASGFAASSVGTYSGQVVMAGFLDRTIAIWVRRLVTLIPALLVLALGVDPTQALVLSQVVLSFGIPFALIPLVLLTRRADVMGGFVNRPVVTAMAGVVAALISALNVFLLLRIATEA